MKSIIARINKSLLENYPLVWNTKLVWMLSIGLGIHLLFFLLGVVSLISPTILQESNAIDLYFTTGMVLVGIILSVIVLTVWLLAMFRNNAFKNFYPQTAATLFYQFLHYLVIVFTCITFYYSYTLGLQAYTAVTYTDTRMDQEIATINKVAPFFTHDIRKYTVDNAKYPSPLDQLYCDRNEKRIDLSAPHYKFKGEYYQFYSLISKTILYDRMAIDEGDFADFEIQTAVSDDPSVDENTNPSGIGTIKASIYKPNSIDQEQPVDPYADDLYLFQKRKGDSITMYYRKAIVDISDFVKTGEPSYFHYSDLFYDPSYMPRDYRTASYNDYGEEEWNLELSGLEKEIIAENHALLERADKAEIESLLTDFLAIATTYRIKNNLTVEPWLELVYHPSDFRIKGLINADNYTYDKRNVSRFENNAAMEIYINEMYSAYYLDSEKLKTALGNISELKRDNIFETSIHIFMWITFVVSLLIFMFRTSGLKPLIFSIIAAGLVMVFIALIFATTGFMGGYNSSEYFLTIVALLILGSISLSGIFLMTSFKKVVGGVLMNLTLASFVPILWLLVILISSIQSDACDRQPIGESDYRDTCFELLRDASPACSYAIMVLTLLFIWMYSRRIMSWRAMPEG